MCTTIFFRTYCSIFVWVLRIFSLSFSLHIYVYIFYIPCPEYRPFLTGSQSIPPPPPSHLTLPPRHTPSTQRNSLLAFSPPSPSSREIEVFYSDADSVLLNGKSTKRQENSQTMGSKALHKLLFPPILWFADQEETYEKSWNFQTVKSARLPLVVLSQNHWKLLTDYEF